MRLANDRGGAHDARAYQLADSRHSHDVPGGRQPRAVVSRVEPQPIQLAEVRITAPSHLPQKQAVLPAQLAPCSAWRNVDMLFVDPAGASGVRNVRALCAKPGEDRCIEADFHACPTCQESIGD